ncbi:hypothetical protein BGX29_003360 [Mortierella sp. GBA35]|nr:hypothetical protein BGX29_003360 [Mortierella sp. GBA35]
MTTGLQAAAGVVVTGGPQAMTMSRSSSSISLHPPRSASSDISQLRPNTPGGSSSSPSGSGGGGGGGANSPGVLRSSTAPIPQHHNQHQYPNTTSSAVGTTASPLAATAPTTNTYTNASIQTRTLHPQVHYIFEDDPLESEILESIPKSQCITMDLDPRSGTIKNVESFLTQLQVMDVKLVQFYGQGQGQGHSGGNGGLSTLGSSTSLSLPAASGVTTMGTGIGYSSSSSSASSLKTMGGGSGGGGILSGGATAADDNQPHSTTSPPSSPSPASVAGTLLARNNSLSSSTLQSSFKSSRRSTDRRGDGDDRASTAATSGPAASTTSTTKDWTLVIEAVELDERDQEQ